MTDPKNPDEYFAEVISRLPNSSGAGEYEFWRAPDLLEDVRTGRLPLGQVLAPSKLEDLRELLSGLIGLFLVSHVGDEHARQQLDVIRKFTFPQKYEVPWTAVEATSKMYGSGHLLRGLGLRRIMHEVADLIVLSQPDAEDVTKSAVSISPKADKGHKLYPRVQEYCKPKTTLRSLAIRIYLKRLEDAGKNKDGAINERTLRRDLKRLERWEEAHPAHVRLKKEYAAGDQLNWKVRIPLRLYTESWRPPTPKEIKEAALEAALTDHLEVKDMLEE